MKRLVSFFLSAIMVLSLFAIAPVFAADAPSIDDSYLFYQGTQGNGVFKSTPNALKGSDGFTYAEDISISSVSAGGYIGVWLGRTNGYIAGYNVDTEELMVTKRKLGSVGGFDVEKVIGDKASFAFEKDTAYRFQIKVASKKVEFYVNGELKLTVEDNNVATPVTLVAYHSGMDVKIDNFLLVNASGKELVSLGFAALEDFAEKGVEFTLDSGYSIPGIIEKPKAIEGEYLLEVEYGTNYMHNTTEPSPYDYAGFTYEMDVCPIATYTDDEEKKPTFVGVHYADFGNENGYTMYMILYNFTRQRFELVKDSGIPYGNGGELLASADYEWKDLETSGTYNWKKIGFRMFLGKMIVTVDGVPVFEHTDEEHIQVYLNKVIIPYTNGEFLLDNIKVAKSTAYDCATGEGEVMSYESFNSGAIDPMIGWSPLTGASCKVIQADELNHCTSENNYSDTPSPDPEIVIERQVLYGPQDAKFFGTGAFTVTDGRYTSVMDLCYIAPDKDGNTFFGYLIGSNNAYFAGYDSVTGAFIIAPWGGAIAGIDRSSVLFTGKSMTIEAGSWNNFGIRHIGSAIEMYFNGELVLSDEKAAEYLVFPYNSNIKFYKVGEYYFDNWILTDVGYDIVNKVGDVLYNMNFDTNSFEAKALGIEENMVGYEIVDADCKGKNENGKYPCNVKYVGEGVDFKVYQCCLCDTFTVYDLDGNVIDMPSGGVAGDANDDGKVDIKDAMAIAKYIAAWDLEVFREDLANVNDDGKANIKDALAIIKVLAEWDVELVYNGPDASYEFKYDGVAIKGLRKEYLGVSGTQVPVDVTKGTYAMKFNLTDAEYLQSVSLISAPSWSDSVGGLTMKIYKWNTDYATTVEGGELHSASITDFNDNTTLSFAINQCLTGITEITNGDYLVEFSAATSGNSVGLWTFAESQSERAIEIYQDGKLVADGNIPHAYLTVGYAA